MKKFLSLLLVALIALSFTGCGTKEIDETSGGPYAAIEDYNEKSKAVYDDALGEFYEVYSKVDEAATISERYVLEAIAEAKLLESGTFMPLSSQGGNYAIGRVAPGTGSPCLWGLDADRYHNLVVTNEIITSEHRTEMKAKYKELKGTGTYEAWVENYLVEKGYTLKDSYSVGSSSDPKTWDWLATYRSADSEKLCNCFDALFEYDGENIQKGALATGYTVSEDGLTYTITIREGAVWTDSQGRYICDVTADDWVAGLQHLLDAQGGLETLAGAAGINIKNADAYLDGTCDFSEVGVKAVDDYTLVYTLEKATPYFITMTSYNPLAPLCRKYYESMGGKFGSEFDASASTYKYGTSPDTIAYCGAYLCTNLTADNVIVFKANESYYNYDNINIKTITYKYNDGTDATKAYKDMLAGDLDGCGLNSSALALAKEDGNFDKYSYVSGTDATAYSAFINLCRGSYTNLYSEEEDSVMTALDKVRTDYAISNQKFRLALLTALDRENYNGQTVGDELALVSVINSYTPGEFVQTTEAVTVEIGGKDVTFEAGTYYGAVVQAQLDADGYQIKVWDPEGGSSGLGSSAGFDGWYNVEYCQELLEEACKELKKQGITIDADNPIYIDYPVYIDNETYANRGAAFKQCVEESTNGLIKVNIVECSLYEWYYAGYYCDYGYQCDYTLYDVSGWGPDYGDPCSYLNTMLPETGDMIHVLGIY